MICGHNNDLKSAGTYQCTNLGTRLLNTQYPNYGELFEVPEKVQIQWHRGGYMITSALMSKPKGGTRIGCPDRCDVEGSLTDIPIAPVHLVFEGEKENPLISLLRRFKKKKIEGPTTEDLQRQLDYLQIRLKELEEVEKKKLNEENDLIQKLNLEKQKEQCTKKKCSKIKKTKGKEIIVCDKKKCRRELKEKQAKCVECGNEQSECITEEPYEKKKHKEKKNKNKKRKKKSREKYEESEENLSDVVIFTEEEKREDYQCMDNSLGVPECACVPLRKIGPEESPDMQACAKDNPNKKTVKKKLKRDSEYCTKDPISKSTNNYENKDYIKSERNMDKSLKDNIEIKKEKKRSKDNKSKDKKDKKRTKEKKEKNKKSKCTDKDSGKVCSKVIINQCEFSKNKDCSSGYDHESNYKSCNKYNSFVSNHKDNKLIKLFKRAPITSEQVSSSSISGSSIRNKTKDILHNLKSESTKIFFKKNDNHVVNYLWESRERKNANNLSLHPRFDNDSGIILWKNDLFKINSSSSNSKNELTTQTSTTTFEDKALQCELPSKIKGEIKKSYYRKNKIKEFKNRKKFVVKNCTRKKLKSIKNVREYHEKFNDGSSNSIKSNYNEGNPQKICIKISGGELIAGSYIKGREEEEVFNIHILSTDNDQNNSLSVMNNEINNEEVRNIFIEEVEDGNYIFGKIIENESYIFKQKHLISGLRLDENGIRLSAGGELEEREIYIPKKSKSEGYLFKNHNKTQRYFSSEYNMIERYIGEPVIDLIKDKLNLIKRDLDFEVKKCECSRKSKNLSSSPRHHLNKPRTSNTIRNNVNPRTSILNKQEKIEAPMINIPINQQPILSTERNESSGCYTLCLNKFFPCCNCKCCKRCCKNLDIACCCYKSHETISDIVIADSNSEVVPTSKRVEIIEKEIIPNKEETVESSIKRYPVESDNHKNSLRQKFLYKFRIFNFECYCGRKFEYLRKKGMTDCQNYEEEEEISEESIEDEDQIEDTMREELPIIPEEIHSKPVANLSSSPSTYESERPPEKKSCGRKCCPCCFKKKNVNKRSKENKKKRKRYSFLSKDPAPLECCWLPCCRFVCRLCCGCCPTGMINNNNNNNEIMEKKEYRGVMSAYPGHAKKAHIENRFCYVWRRNFVNFHRERLINQLKPCRLYCILCQAIDPEELEHEIYSRKYYLNKLEQKQSSYFDAKPTLYSYEQPVNEEIERSWKITDVSSARMPEYDKKCEKKSQQPEVNFQENRTPWVGNEHRNNMPMYSRPGFWKRLKRHIISIL